MKLLTEEVQFYINSHLNADANKIALAKSPFPGLSSAVLANQIAAKKKAQKKLPTWFNHENIIYPSTLSIEQTSSEDTAAYKQQLLKGDNVVDITAGFGVDSYYLAKKATSVYSCEINPQLSEISANNAKVLGATNIHCMAADGLEFIKSNEQYFGTIYVDPARRNTSGKVFKLAECTPNVVENLTVLLAKADRIIIKTSPLLDLQAGLNELRNVSEIHLVSVKNECKELLWVLDTNFIGKAQLICAALNEVQKQIQLPLIDEAVPSYLDLVPTHGYLYEPDAALMKSGAFNAIANHYNLKKLEKQSHLYYSSEINSNFIGRIFKIESASSANELKKEKSLFGNVITRNFPEKAENLVKKLKIKSDNNTFYLFTQVQQRYVVFKTKIEQYY